MLTFNFVPMYGFDEIKMEKPEAYIVSDTLHAKRERKIKEETKQLRERYYSLDECGFDPLVSLINLPEGEYLLDYGNGFPEYLQMEEAVEVLLEGNYSIVTVKKGMVYR